MNRNPRIAIQRLDLLTAWSQGIFFHSLRGPQRNLTRFDGNVKRSPLTRSGARFSKVPVTFRARNRNIENKSAGPGQQSTPFCFINCQFYYVRCKTIKISFLHVNNNNKGASSAHITRNTCSRTSRRSREAHKGWKDRGEMD